MVNFPQFFIIHISEGSHFPSLVHVDNKLMSCCGEEKLLPYLSSPNPS